MVTENCCAWQIFTHALKQFFYANYPIKNQRKNSRVLRKWSRQYGVRGYIVLLNNIGDETAGSVYSLNQEVTIDWYSACFTDCSSEIIFL